MKKIAAVSNQKGGVGKTTTAINLAASVAVHGKKVLLIDMDPQANATSGLGIEIDDSQNSIYEVLLEPNLNPLDAVVNTEIPTLKLLPSAIRLVGAQVELIEKGGKREFVLKDRIQTLINEFEYILIDCPPSLGILTLNGLTASKSVIIPVQTEYYALEGLSQLMDTINLVQRSLNPTLKIEGFLLTMFDGRLNLSKQVKDEALKFLSDKVFRTIIPRNVKISESPSHGRPVILYDPSSIGAVSYMKLAKEILLNER